MRGFRATRPNLGPAHAERHYVGSFGSVTARFHVPSAIPARGLLGVYLIRTIGRPDPGEAVTASSEAILAATQPFKVALGRMIVAESGYVRQATTLRATGSALRGALADLAQQLEHAVTPRDSLVLRGLQVDTLGRLLVTSEARCSALDSAYRGCAERAALLQGRVDTLTSALARQIGVSSCRVIFLPCISRTQALAVGILLGGVTAWVLHP